MGPTKAAGILILVWIYCLVSTQSKQSFTCRDGNTIRKEQFCDGNRNCVDGSDEIHTTITSEPLQRCLVGTRSCFIHFQYICNDSVACGDVNPCDAGCPEYYKCQNNSCVRRSTICDGDPCNGCPEDDGWKTGIGFQCVRNGELCRLPQQLVFDEVQDCDQGEDLCFDWPDQPLHPNRITKDPSIVLFNQSRCFKCLDGTMIVPRHKVCDGVINCSDLSDECLCNEKVLKICDDVVERKLAQTSSKNYSCAVGQVDCGDRKCINRSSVCDSLGDCSDNKDELDCDGTLRCDNANGHIQQGQKCRCDSECGNAIGVICDGLGQCPPRFRYAKWVADPGFPEDECSVSCPNQLNCTPPILWAVSPNPPKLATCLASRMLDNGTMIVEEHKVNEKQICDGIPHCDVTQDDENELLCPGKLFHCPAKNRINIPISRLCDGTVDCDDGSDESRANCPHRFFCSSLGGTKVSLNNASVCDFISNCDGSEDELNCTTDGRFYCENGIPLFVEKEKIYDGRADCSDVSDECPTTIETINDGIFSSRYQLIANPILRGLLWIVGLIAFCGNLIVIVTEVKTLSKIIRKPTSVPTRTNHVLIFNLALADFLMGVYLLMLGVAGIVFDGTFCAHELAWRSGTTCQAMGALVVISSKTSIITMVLLTTVRLHAVFRPFEASRKPSWRTLIILITGAWCISFVWAFLPFTTRLQYLFATEAIIPNNLFFQNVIVDFDSAKTWAEKLFTYEWKLNSSSAEDFLELQNAKSWPDLQLFLTHIGWAEQLQTIHVFGYYSKISVCLPRVLVTEKDKAWPFSIALICFSFFAFVYVVCAYCLMLWKVNNKPMNKTKKSSNDKGSKAMQRKIFRLVATDFCCWIPVSIMGFINFSGIALPEISYVVSAIVLLPINSALNPILYSDVFDKFMMKLRLGKRSCNDPNHSSSAQTTGQRRSNITLLTRM